ncbi:MAG: NAD-dependent succinate-semialdehyde dehydrogenase [Thermoproteota archaeon]|nr:NAD-dependent succinate-semialdehyde dehydrogenase [Thermoproteota archaeon]
MSMSNNGKIQTVNPASGKGRSSYDIMSIEQIEHIAKNAQVAFGRWKKKEILERCDYIRDLAKVLTKNKDRYAKIVTEEMGKPITQAIAEVEKCALVCEYYSENAEVFLRDEIVPTEFRKSFISFEPLGVVAGIMPWNFPFWQVMRYAIPTLIAGNVAVLKHSSVCTGSALQIQEAFRESGFPENVFQCIIGDYKAGEALVQSDKIDAVSVTGSVNTGKRVAELAARGLKKCVLELGGSDPFVVLEDADINQTAHLAAQSRLLNTGQSCIAAKRFIVVKEVADKFSKLFTQNVEAEVVGDPMNYKTTIGPLVRESQRQALINQVEDAKLKGAKILTGGRIIAGDGYFYLPTIITNVNHQMVILSEEVFGPVAPIIIVDNEADAILEANNSEFGLGASLWTSNFEKGVRLARDIRSGVVRVNEMVRSDPRLPFGGIKSSGIGRELSYYGTREFVNVKSIVVKDISHKLLVE